MIKSEFSSTNGTEKGEYQKDGMKFSNAGIKFQLVCPDNSAQMVAKIRQGENKRCPIVYKMATHSAR